MTIRKLLLESYENLQGDSLKGIYQHVRNIAKTDNKELTITVNSRRNCDQFIKKIFDDKTTNKLIRGESIIDKGVSISLKSKDGIKEYDTYGYFFGIHASQLLVNKLESNTKKEFIFIVAVSQKSEHLDEWAQTHNAEKLKIN